MRTMHSTCICEYISPGAAALYAIFHGMEEPLLKVPNADCPIHGTGPRMPEVFTFDVLLFTRILWMNGDETTMSEEEH